MAKFPAGYGSTGNPFKHGGENHVRWIENPVSAYGLRVVGFADEIAKRNYAFASGIDHKGWFADDFCDEIIRGVVLQMAAKDGKPRYLPGYADPNNRGCYCVSFDEIFEGERNTSGGEYYDASEDKAARDCARRADQFAEHVAESEREYRQAQQAGSRFYDLGESIKETRKACLALIRETKAACKAITDYPAIKTTIRARVESMVADISQAREERAKLVGEYGEEAGFKDY